VLKKSSLIVIIWIEAEKDFGGILSGTYKSNSVKKNTQKIQRQKGANK
jgi:hypothetical protein